VIDDPDGVSWAEPLPRGVLDVLVEDEGVGTDPFVMELGGVSPLVVLP
jgi:hypothetical protein